ncbi:MAG: helix-turn-helix domain-containing protein [Deltaproteobacteria bacterium]
MDRSTVQSSRRQRARPDHHQHNPELPRHWITLPVAVQRAALQHPLLGASFPSHVGFFPRARNHRIERGPIASNIVNYCVKGRGYCELRGRRFEVAPGDVMVVPSGHAHAYGADAANPWSIYWFHAMGAWWPALLAELGVGVESPVVQVRNPRELVPLFSELRQTLEQDYSLPRLLYASRVLTHLMGVLIRIRHELESARGDAHARVRATLEFLRQHASRPVRVEALAAMADLSASQYAAHVRKLTGYSPKEHLIRLRIHRAAQLLDTTNDAVASIARQVGYEDPLYFSRAFRRLYDLSPSTYRSSRR